VAGLRRFPAKCFSSHLPCFQHFLLSASQAGHALRAQTIRLTHVIENAQVSRILAVWTDFAI
jgi:hypothetical protein